MQNDFLVYWLSQTDSELLEEEMSEKLGALPEYFQEQSSSRYGRAGRCRLWVAKGIEVHDITWDDAKPLAKVLTDNDCGGIVIYRKDLLLLAVLPGFATDFALNVVSGADL